MRNAVPLVSVLCLYMIPAALYCLYNNLQFTNLASYDPTTYFLLLQMRVVVTSILFQVSVAFVPYTLSTYCHNTVNKSISILSTYCQQIYQHTVNTLSTYCQLSINTVLTCCQRIINTLLACCHCTVCICCLTS